MGVQMRRVPCDVEFLECIGRAVDGWGPSWVVCRDHFEEAVRRLNSKRQQANNSGCSGSGSSSNSSSNNNNRYGLVSKTCRIHSKGREWDVTIRSETENLVLVRYDGFEPQWDEWIQRDECLAAPCLAADNNDSENSARVRKVTQCQPIWRYCFGVLGIGADLGPSGIQRT